MPTAPQERDAPQERRRRALPRRNPKTVCPVEGCGGELKVYTTRRGELLVTRYLKCPKCEARFQEHDEWGQL